MKLASAKVTATKDSIEKIKPTADKFGMEYYEKVGHYTSIKSSIGLEDKPYDFCMLMVRFTMKDRWENVNEHIKFSLIDLNLIKSVLWFFQG